MPKIEIDIEELIMSLESQADLGEFFLDKQSGEIILISHYPDDDADAQRARIEHEPARFLYIQPVAARIGWAIMDDFIRAVQNVEAQQALARALTDRKPFRSFKDELLQFPEIREQWFAHHTARMTKIARDWLAENDIVVEDARGAAESSVILVQGGAVKITASGAYPEEGQAPVQITFSDNAVLNAAFWRLIKDGKASLSSFDNEQQYGLPAPIDAVAELQKELNGCILDDVRLNGETGDLVLRFAGNRKLQVFNFTGYEVWSIRFSNGATEYSNYALEG